LCRVDRAGARGGGGGGGWGRGGGGPGCEALEGDGGGEGETVGAGKEGLGDTVGRGEEEAQRGPGGGSAGGGGHGWAATGDGGLFQYTVVWSREEERTRFDSSGEKRKGGGWPRSAEVSKRPTQLQGLVASWAWGALHTC